jgi:2-phosphosulfolactate phosphatase
MYSEEGKYSIQVCLSPLSYPLFRKHGAIVVIADIFRATTAMVAGIENGLQSIIPVADISESEQYRQRGFIVAGERDGKTLDCAHFGNSPFNFMAPNLKGKVVVMNTTNGTQAIRAAANDNNMVAIGAFTNLKAVAEFAFDKKKDLLILCAGWKNRFSLEDTLFAGALIEELMTNHPGNFKLTCDSAIAGVQLWNAAKNDLNEYIKQAAHYHRLHRMGLEDVIPYCLSLNISDTVPVLEGIELKGVKAEM